MSQKQTELTAPQQEIERHQRDREQLAECVTEVRLRRADLGPRARGGWFSTGPEPNVGFWN